MRKRCSHQLTNEAVKGIAMQGIGRAMPPKAYAVRLSMLIIPPLTDFFNHHILQIYIISSKPLPVTPDATLIAMNADGSVSRTSRLRKNS